MSVEKLVMDQGLASASLAGLPRPYKRQGGRRTGLVLLAGGCLGGVLVCAVLMPLVYVTMSEMQAEVTELRNMMTSRPEPTTSPGQNATASGAHRERRQADLTPSYGDVYVRWGRETCETDDGHAETIYSGVVGTGHYGHYGGGSDYQCLPLKDLEWNNPSSGSHSHSLIYGAEYENTYGRFSRNNMQSINNPNNYGIPCSLCHVAGRSTHAMIPARRSCPQGWGKEYEGYLMSSYYSHQNSKNYICVDEAPNLVQGSYVDQNQGRLYLVETQCGALPCPPYASGYELTCVVCTK